MQLADLINRSSPPLPWAEGDNIPWNEPGFSRRMLNEHLSQEHDAASRRFAIIDQHVDWIHTLLLARQPATLLDLACGPGFYTERLARLGHTCHGIDYSPASIEYAITTASRERLACTYICRDIRQAEFPQGNDLAMLIYGEFNIFRPTDAVTIVRKSWQALKPSGILLLEPHTYQLVQQMGEQPASWYSSSGGLFSERPHVVLQEHFWDAGTHTSTFRYYIVDALSGQVTRYAQTFQAYQDDEYCLLLSGNGFEEIQILPGLLGEDSPKGLIAIVARKQFKLNG
jgi:SAM-dependent methyltransferase